MLWALQFVVVGNISALKSDFTLRRRFWTEVTAAGFKGNGQGGKHSARLIFAQFTPDTFSVFPKTAQERCEGEETAASWESVCPCQDCDLGQWFHC